MTEEIARRMGAEVQWLPSSWDAISAGNGNGRWDLSVARNHKRLTEPRKINRTRSAINT